MLVQNFFPERTRQLTSDSATDLGLLPYGAMCNDVTELT